MIWLPSRSGRIAASSSACVEHPDAVLEAVVGRAAGRRPCAGCAWCSRRASACATGPGGARRRAHSGARPRRSTRPLAVAVEAQVQLHEQGHLVDDLTSGSAARSTACGPTWPRPPRGGGSSPGHQPRTGGSAACRCRAAARPGAAPGPARSRGRVPSPARSPGRARSMSARRRPCAGGARRSPGAARAARAGCGRPTRCPRAARGRGAGMRTEQLRQLVADPLGARPS